MRRYETMVIVDPDLSSEKREPLFERMEETISQQGGALIVRDDWGPRKLAYEIKKRTRGHYVRFDYCGNGELVSELERFCRIDDRVMKYMTIQLADQADPEAIKAQMAQSTTAEAASAEKSEDADASTAVAGNTETPDTAEEE